MFAFLRALFWENVFCERLIVISPPSWLFTALITVTTAPESVFLSVLPVAECFLMFSCSSWWEGVHESVTAGLHARPERMRVCVWHIDRFTLTIQSRAVEFRFIYVRFKGRKVNFGTFPHGRVWIVSLEAEMCRLGPKMRLFCKRYRPNMKRNCWSYGWKCCSD